MKTILPWLCLPLALLATACRPEGRAGEKVAPGTAAPPAVKTGSAPQAAAPAGTSAPAGDLPAAAPPVLPVPDLGYNAREGRALYRHYCLTCHGDEGHGDGFNAYNLDPKPRDLSDPAFQSKRSDDDLATLIRSGGGAAGLSTGMPPWGRTLGERKIRNLVEYLRALPPPTR